jgi:hydrogenase maturation protease
MNILVLGIGQSLRGDDAAGLEAVRLWQQAHPLTAQRVQVAISELPGLALLDFLSGVEAAILVDAVMASAAPGTLHRVGPDELEAFSAGSGSAHGWGVAETLQLGRSLYPSISDCRITLIGIEASQMDLGAGLSDEVQAALPGAAQMIEQEILSLL